MERNNIYHMDAIDLLRGLDDASIDMCLCDPPYATTAIEWDKALDWASIWLELRRICKPGAACVFTASQPFTTDLINSNRAWFRYEWIWEKTLATGYLNANRNPMKAHENILVFYDMLSVYNPQKEAGLPYIATSGNVGAYVQDKSVGGYVTSSTGERFPRSVLQFDSVKNPIHPTQKPVDLFEYLIRTYTLPDALVLDFCIGSGTTAVAARNTGRHYIGGDSNLAYVEAARLRLINSDPFQHSTLPNGERQLSLFATLADDEDAARGKDATVNTVS